MNLAVFASGNGSNFQAIAKATTDGRIRGKIVVLFCDKADAFAMERAERLGIPAVSFSPKEFDNKASYEQNILRYLKKYHVELIVLAGYMRIIGDTLLDAFPNRIINIHPSLLPAFPGLHGIKDAFDANVVKTGVTVHYIDKGVDTGPVIAQESVIIEKIDTLASLEAKIHQVEHRLYPDVLAKVIKKIKE